MREKEKLGKRECVTGVTEKGGGLGDDVAELRVEPGRHFQECVSTHGLRISARK